MKQPPSPMTIADLRREKGLSLEAFASLIGVSSKGRMSEIERNLQSLTGEQALAVEELSEGRINAGDLCSLIAKARAA